MYSAFPDWRQRLHDPIASSLLFSLSLHLALLALVQPAPGGRVMETMVINARLALPAPETPRAMPQDIPEPEPEPPAEVVTQPVVPPVTVPQPLLTSHVPSPAPPLPVAPLPVAPTPAPVHLPVPSAAPPGPPEAKPISAPANAAVADATPHNGPSTPLNIGIDTTWYVARQVDMHARSIGSIVPNYPEQARRRNQEATLKLMVKIDDLGRVRDVEVVEADLPGVFDEAALEAFRNARFQPAMKDGRPVRYQAYIRVVFKLRD
ncbi:MAG: energy transducer TonB [Gammaproteobacteria bacterium]|nr:energy transducer TonB [Gammaproteobacteria bacterium]